MEKRIYISGMHCPACGLLIRETIKDISGITLVSLTSSGVLNFISDTDESSLALKEAISACGYTVSEEMIAKKSDINRKEKSILIGAGLFFWWGITTFDITGYAATIGTTGTLGYGEMFLLGLIASLSTCLALVGGFVLMWGSLQGGQKVSWYKTLLQQGLFQIGRLGGFALGGFVLGLLGSAIIFSPTINGIINLIVSILLLFIGRNMLNLFSLKMPSRGGGNRFLSMLKYISQKKRGGIFVGALTFFLPCGFAQLAQINAMSTGNPLQGAFLLFMFALGTMPVLLLLGFTGNRFQSNQSSFGYKILGVLLVVLSLFLIQNAINLLGWG